MRRPPPPPPKTPLAERAIARKLQLAVRDLNTALSMAADAELKVELSQLDIAAVGEKPRIMFGVEIYAEVITDDS